MTTANNFPNIRPSLLLDFARSQVLDPRITFTRASTATRVNNDGLVETVASGIPRFDFDPVTLNCKGLLVEEARTNISLYSEDFSNAAWVKPGILAFGSGSTINAAVAPDGTTTADLLTENTASGGHYIEQSITGNATNTYTFSVYLKPNGRSGAILQVYDWAATANSIYMYVNIATGQVITPASATGSAVVAGSSVTMLPNGWCRLTISGQPGPSTGATMRPRIAMVNVSSVYTGDGTSGMYMWGAQYELGAFPTSYIPTVASTVTRAADTASMTGTNFSSWFNNAEGTMYIDCAYNYAGAAGYPRLLAAVGADANLNEIGIYTRTTGVASPGFAYFAVVVGGSAEGDPTFVLPPVAGNTRAVFAYTVNNLSATSFGLTVGTDTVSRIPTCQELRIFGQVRYQLQPSGTISKVAYYPERLSDTQLQALTS